MANLTSAENGSCPMCSGVGVVPDAGFCSCDAGDAAARAASLESEADDVDSVDG